MISHVVQLYHNVVGSGGLKEHVLDGGRSAHAKEQFLSERTCPGARRHSAMSCAKNG